MQKFQTAITGPTGNVIPNAVITIVTLGGVPATIYAGNGVSPYPSNQVTTNSQGEFSFYAANGRYSYTVAATNFVTEAYTDFLLFDPADAPAGTYEIDTEYQLATAGQTVITLTQITYIPGSNNLSVYVNGVRLILNVDYAETSSTLVTMVNPLALNDEVVCVVGAEISDAVSSVNVGFLQAGTGAVARTTQSKLRETVSVKDFGAVGNGVTDDTAAIQAAIDAVYNSFGGIVFLPQAVYKISGITLRDGVTLQGEGAWASVILTSSASATVINMGISSAIKEIKVASSVTRTSSFYIDIQSNGAIINNCEFEGYYICINVGTISGALPVGCLITDCEFRSPVIASGTGAILFTNFSNAEVRNCIISGPALPATQPDFGIQFNNGDTAFVYGTNITLHGKALAIRTSALLNCYGVTIDGCVFDSSGTITGGASASSAEILPTGGVYNTRISNSWFGLSQGGSGCYIGTSGVGVVDGITFTGCEFTDNGSCGLIAVGAGVKNWIVTGGHSGGNTSSGIRAADATTYFTITGHRAGDIANRGVNNIGISIDAAASNYYIIEGCNVVGNTLAGILDSGTGSTAIVANNLGYNGAAAVSGVTVGASPWSYTSGHTPETMYFAGGTVSNITLDGTTVQNTTAATIQLAPNETMSVTYTVVPTVIRKRL